MAAGAVPVSTNVGTISDFIENRKSGLLVSPGDAEALSNAILELINNDELYNRMREALLIMREEYRFEKVSDLWDHWIKEIKK